MLAVESVCALSIFKETFLIMHAHIHHQMLKFPKLSMHVRQEALWILNSNDLKYLTGSHFPSRTICGLGLKVSHSHAVLALLEVRGSSCPV